MSNPIQAFKNLTPRTRLTIGISFLAWGAVGLYISDSAEKHFGLEPSLEDKKALESVMPKITTIEREGKS